MSAPAGAPWEGQAAAKARERAYYDMVKVREASDQLREVSAVARRGEEQLQACKQGVLEAVRDARTDEFDTGDDYSVTDRARGGSAEFRAARQVQAQGHAAFIRHRVAALVATDQQIRTRITAATKGVDSVTFQDARGIDDTIAGGDKHSHVEAIDHTWKTDPAATPQPGPGAAPSADDIRRVLDTLPQGDESWIREIRSKQDLDNLWNWLTRNGVERPGGYRTVPGEMRDLPDGTIVGRREAANSTEQPALDIRVPGEKGYVKVHINPRGGVPDIPAPARPAPPKAPPALVESPRVTRPPVESAPSPAEPAQIPGKGFGGSPLFPNLRIIEPPHSRHGQLHPGDDAEDTLEEE
jgi:hypothetical protein